MARSAKTEPLTDELPKELAERGTDEQIEEWRADNRRLFREQFNAVSISDDAAPDSFDDALALFAAESIELTRTDDEALQSKFPEIDKAKLVNRECVFLSWHLSRPESETFGTPYILVRGITRDGTWFRFTDGSTGIARTLISFTDKRMKAGNPAPNAGLHLLRGLSVSEYDTTDDKGNPVHGTTYYIATE